MDTSLIYEDLSPRVLRALRKRSDLSQREVGNRLRRSRSFVSRVERGKRKLSTVELRNYLKVLRQKTADYLSILGSIKFIKSVNNVPEIEAKKPDIANASVANNREEVIEIIRSYFSNKPVVDVCLFGSFARNEQDSSSDVDIYITLDERKKVTIFDIAKYRNELINGLGRSVDIVISGSEYDFMKNSIRADKISLYE